MIALARSTRAKVWAQRSWTGSALAKGYVAGATVSQAVAAASEVLRRETLCASDFLFGEYVPQMEAVEENVYGFGKC